MIYKHNRGRTWNYRALAMGDGYKVRVRAYVFPAPLYTPAPTELDPQGYSNRPDPDWIGAESPDWTGDDDDGLMAIGVLL